MVFDEMLVILGKTETGEKFRPSDWAEMLSGQMCVFAEDKRLCYSEYLRPATIDGYNSLVVKKELQKINKEVWNNLLYFARDNKLIVKNCDEQCPIF